MRKRRKEKILTLSCLIFGTISCCCCCCCCCCWLLVGGFWWILFCHLSLLLSLFLSLSLPLTTANASLQCTKQPMFLVVKLVVNVKVSESIHNTHCSLFPLPLPLPPSPPVWTFFFDAFYLFFRFSSPFFSSTTRSSVSSDLLKILQGAFFKKIF